MEMSFFIILKLICLPRPLQCSFFNHVAKCTYQRSDFLWYIIVEEYHVSETVQLSNYLLI